MKFFSSLLLLLMLLFLATPLVSSQFHISNWVCNYVAGNYTSDSSYKNSLNLLFPYLENQASLTSFGNYSVGDGVDRVYMLYNCRGDLDGENCRGCVQEAAKRILTLCPAVKEAIMWFDECMLRFANRTIFSLEEETPYVWDFSVGNVSNPEIFGQELAIAIDGVIKQAAYNVSTRGYAVGEVNITLVGTEYLQAQCTPDILGDRCERCLRAAFRSMAGCCGTARQSIQFYFPSCVLRYSIAPFIQTGPDVSSIMPTASPQSPANTTSNSSQSELPPIKGAATACKIGAGDFFVFLFTTAMSMLFAMPTSK